VLIPDAPVNPVILQIPGQLRRSTRETHERECYLTAE